MPAKDIGSVPEKALKGRPLDVATRSAENIECVSCPSLTLVDSTQLRRLARTRPGQDQTWEINLSRHSNSSTAPAVCLCAT